MVRPRVLGVALTLGLVPGLTLLAPAPVGAEDAEPQAQTVVFSSTPPSGADWFYGNTRTYDAEGEMVFYGYVASASASSGLPVTYSIAEASAGICEIDKVVEDDPVLGTGALVTLVGAGTCTVRADQPGDDAHLPAEQVSQSFEIEKVWSELRSVKATKGLLGLAPSTFTATLTIPEWQGSFWTGVGGYPGQVVTFAAGGRQVCSATTDGKGIATCSAKLGFLTWLGQPTFTAAYAGDANYTPSSKIGIFGLA